MISSKYIFRKEPVSLEDEVKEYVKDITSWWSTCVISPTWRIFLWRHIPNQKALWHTMIKQIKSNSFKRTLLLFNWSDHKCDIKKTMSMYFSALLQFPQQYWLAALLDGKKRFSLFMSDGRSWEEMFQWETWSSVLRGIWGYGETGKTRLRQRRKDL